MIWKPRSFFDVIMDLQSHIVCMTLVFVYVRIVNFIQSVEDNSWALTEQALIS